MNDKIIILKNIKHDIKAPINTINGLATLIKTKEKNNIIETYCKKIIETSSLIMMFLDDIIDLFSYEDHSLLVNEKVFSIRKLIKNICTISTIQSLNKKQKFLVDVNIKGNELFFGDDKLISRVLLNIVSNAIKYTPENGTISFESFIIEEDEEKSSAYFIIEDNGYGIEKNFIEKIFQPFSRENSSHIKNEEGTGIGLTISKAIIDKLNGEIVVESTKDKGSRFTIKISLKNIKISNNINISNMIILSDFETFNHIKNIYLNSNIEISYETDLFSLIDNINTNIYDVILIDISYIKSHTKYFLDLIKLKSRNAYIILLIDNDNSIRYEYSVLDGIIKKPFFPSAIDEIIANSKAENNPLKNLNFLLVEDNYLNQEIIKNLIISNGGNIVVKSDGKQCIEHLKIENNYDVILLDICMPGLDGIETFKKITNNKLILEKTVVIAISSNYDETYTHLGFDCVLNKNFTVSELLTAIKKE